MFSNVYVFTLTIIIILHLIDITSLVGRLQIIDVTSFVGRLQIKNTEKCFHSTSLMEDPIPFKNSFKKWKMYFYTKSFIARSYAPQL